MRIEKNEKYSANELPIPYEIRMQYGRSLRLSVGPAESLG